MTPVDLTPAARRLSALVANVPDDALTGPTPCPDYSLGDLIDHIGGLALAFTAAARKEIGGDSAQGPSGDAARLGDDWRVRIPEQLAALAEAWRDPAAWTGMTQAGGVDLPGEIGGLVALDEIVIHGWDVARASAQPYECEPQLLEAVHEFLAGFSTPETADQRGDMFGPVGARSRRRATPRPHRRHGRPRPRLVTRVTSAG